MNKTLNKAVLTIALALGFYGISQAQVSLTSTTLASAVSGPALYAGTSVQIDQVVFLASVTGISAPTLPGAPVSVIYIGHEAMGVFTVNTSLKSVGVFRGYLGTQAAPHPTSDMVLISNVYSTTQAFGANPLPSGFFQIDPPYNGACIASNTPTTPWVNVLTGAQWVCSGQTNTWAPSWGNQLANPGSWVQTGTVASAATILPTGPYFNMSGTGAIATITLPVGFNAQTGGCFIANPTGVWTWTAAGNIQTAGTVTAATTPVTFCWNVALQKWVPSRLA
jgi:hypothetical protein